jgi:hypothetical protein
MFAQQRAVRSDAEAMVRPRRGLERAMFVSEAIQNPSEGERRCRVSVHRTRLDGHVQPRFSTADASHERGMGAVDKRSRQTTLEEDLRPRQEVKTSCRQATETFPT